VRGEGASGGNEGITDYTRATERDAVRSRTIAGGLWELEGAANSLKRGRLWKRRKTSYRNVGKIEMTKGAVGKEQPAARRRATSDMQVAGKDVGYVCRTRVVRHIVESGGLLHNKRDGLEVALGKGRRGGGLREARVSETWRTCCRLLRVRFLGRLDNKVRAEVDMTATDISNSLEMK
jgi:hypothetical protein